jgi:hypothetical protein
MTWWASPCCAAAPLGFLWVVDAAAVLLPTENGFLESVTFGFNMLRHVWSRVLLFPCNHNFVNIRILLLKWHGGAPAELSEKKSVTLCALGLLSRGVCIRAPPTCPYMSLELCYILCGRGFLKCNYSSS